MIQLKYFPDSMCSELKKGLKELFKIIKKVTMSVLILWEDMENWFDTKWDFRDGLCLLKLFWSITIPS